jgi:hypothetical protein
VIGKKLDEEEKEISRYITILFRNGKAQSIPINFAMRKAIKVVYCLNHHEVAEAIITDKDYKNKEKKENE